MAALNRIKSPHNVFNATVTNTPSFKKSYYTFDSTKYANFTKPDRRRLTYGSEETILSAIYNRIAIDVASLEFAHAKLDENERYTGKIDSYLNDCFRISANLDQAPSAFMQDAALSLIDEGCIAIVATKTTANPVFTDSYDIGSLRVGQIVQWQPDRVKVRLYNEETGRHEDTMLLKRTVAIVENPFYSTMNEPNSIAMRLKEKLALLDKTDKQNNSGKLDLIVQLPFAVKGDLRRAQAAKRKRDIEMQLADSKYGIAYIDGTEKITQLNRAVENNLQPQIEYLTKQLYTRLGITEEIMNGTANEEAMINYYNRVIEPICSAITEEMKRKFLSKTAISQGQTIYFFRDPFKLVPVSQLAEISDKFTRNEIASSNDIRSVMGWIPSKQPGADELRNKNLNQSSKESRNGLTDDSYSIDDSLAGLDDLDSEIDSLIKEIGE